MEIRPFLAGHRLARYVQDPVEIPEPVEGQGQILAGLIVDLELADRDALATHRPVETVERLECKQTQDVARAGQTAGAEPGPGPVETHRHGKRREARREVGDDGRAGRGDAFPAMRVLVDDHPAQQLHRRRRRDRQPSVRGVDAAPADGERPARPRGVETLDQPGRADDVRDGVVRADLVEAHVVDGHSVHRRLRRGEPGEDIEGPGADPGVEVGAFEQGADVAVEMMLVGRLVVATTVTMAVAGAVVHVWLAIRAARLVHALLAPFAARLSHREPRSGQCVVGVIDAFDGGDGVEPRALQGRDERRLQLGPGVEHRRREHVAGNASDRIELDMHGRYCKSPTGTAHSEYTAPPVVPPGSRFGLGAVRSGASPAPPACGGRGTRMGRRCQPATIVPVNTRACNGIDRSRMRRGMLHGLKNSRDSRRLR